MAMSLKGKNTQYKLNRIQPRHFVSTAEYCMYPIDKAAKHYEYFVDNVEYAIAEVKGNISAGFPECVAAAIYAGLRKQARKRFPK
ncbi:hypothetical protein BAE46_12470 [Glaciecola punicea]|uniref:hypothetical protein n=1 Tax=Glaciecola punicea TaxID=56804 RepID=UPI000872DFC8|nr:hypothetical protein [Glaciecola punicea]OFA30029.1 hypothetical protein BAE46_12470 [Glaciecola punicea]